jgi:uncharacterized protein (TIGR03067 family)
MRREFMRPLALLVLVALSSAHVDDASTKDREALQGTWTVVEAEENGESLDRIKGNTLVIDGDKFTISTKTSDLKGTFTLHTGIMPKGMDWVHTGGAVEGRTWYAIYELEDNRLKICYADPNPDQQRPNEFTTQPGSNRLLIVVEREDR